MYLSTCYLWVFLEKTVSLREAVLTNRAYVVEKKFSHQTNPPLPSTAPPENKKNQEPTIVEQQF